MIRKSSRVALLVLTFLLPMAGVVEAGQPFDCVGDAYAVSGQSLERIVSDGSGGFSFENIATLSNKVNAIGFNLLDNHIYGTIRNGSNRNQVVRVDKDGAIEILGFPLRNGQPQAINSYSGTVDGAGNYYVNDNGNNWLYTIPLGNLPAAGTLTTTRVPLTGTLPANTFTDLTFNVDDGLLYSLRNGNLYSINPATGVVSQVVTQGDAFAGNAFSGGSWSVATGYGYFYHQGNSVYSVDFKTVPFEVVNLGTAANASGFDATNCAQPVLMKNASVDLEERTNRFTYTFQIRNVATTPIVVSFDDTAPNNVSFDPASLSPAAPGGGTVSTLTATQLVIDNITVASNSTVIFTIDALVASNAPDGEIPNQATITLGSSVIDSDDPTTGDIEDPAIIEVRLPDYGDAAASYGDAAHRRLADSLYLGNQLPDGEDDSQADDGSDEEGVVFSTVADGSGTSFQLTATVIGTNETGAAAMLCGYLDGAADGNTGGSFDQAVTYAAGQVGLADPAVGAGNEELCIQVPASGATAVALNGGSNPASANCTGGTNFTCTLSWSPDFTASVTTFARFRLTSDVSFFAAPLPTPTGTVADGEVEDYELDINPTAVTIGSVEIELLPVSDFIDYLGADQMDPAQLLALLEAWAPSAAALLSDADPEQITREIFNFLDPDGDGQVAILRWTTLEERGTIGFFAERRVAAKDSWQRVNGGMLPGLITAPLGGQYMLADPRAEPGADYQYRLLELEARGSTRVYGPFDLQLPR